MSDGVHELRVSGVERGERDTAHFQLSHGVYYLLVHGVWRSSLMLIRLQLCSSLCVHSLRLFTPSVAKSRQEE